MGCIEGMRSVGRGEVRRNVGGEGSEVGGMAGRRVCDTGQDEDEEDCEEVVRGVVR